MLFFEATVEGVNISNLEDCLLGWKRSVPGLTFGFRRLVNLNPEYRLVMTDKLRTFANQNANKPYERNILEIALGFFNANRKEDNSSFFCSQLVAACWKKVGILSADKISSNYFPSSFGKRNVPLEQGAMLSNIIIYKDWPDPDTRNDLMKYRHSESSRRSIYRLDYFTSPFESPKTPVLKTPHKENIINIDFTDQSEKELKVNNNGGTDPIVLPELTRNRGKTKHPSKTHCTISRSITRPSGNTPVLTLHRNSVDMENTLRRLRRGFSNPVVPGESLSSLFQTKSRIKSEENPEKNPL